MQEVKQTLLNLSGKIAQEQNYVGYSVDVQEISGGGSNITSALFHTTIHAEGKPELKLFAKVALLNDNVRKHSPIPCPFTTELYFYNKLQKQFERIQDKNDIPKEHRLRLPKLYGSHDEYLSETLVLEDFVAQGFEIFDRQQTADWEYMSTAIEILAKFHALSLAFHDDDPVGFEEASEALTFDLSKMKSMMPMVKPKMIARALEATKDQNRKQLEKFFEREPCPLEQYLDTFCCKNKNVLLHGDFKPSNLMHRRRNGKLEIVPVDFQMVVEGDPLRDLMYFIFTATDEDFRRQHYHEVLDLYHERLREALRRFHINAEDVYSESTYKAQLEQHSMLGLSISVAVLPMVLVEEKQIPYFDKDYKVSDFVVDSSALFKERLNGVINNYVEWGLL